MTNQLPDHLQRFVTAIQQSGFSIDTPIDIGDPDLWIPSLELEVLLDVGLRGTSLYNLPNRTRSKVVNEHICRILGYPIPRTFARTEPRFFGQKFDKYVQKSNNLQIWNQELAPTRRYVIIKVSQDNIIERVKVVTGDTLALLDTTGRLTTKYQARLTVGDQKTELVSAEDTENMRELLRIGEEQANVTHSPVDYPTASTLLTIQTIFERLQSLVGQSFPALGQDQERNRGASLHRLVCQHLGYTTYKDDGRFPDIRNQLLEVKLQTAQTIDLGLVCPNSQDILDVPQIENRQIRHCDVRYALFYGRIDTSQVTLTHFFLTTGESFFTRFPQFQGNIINGKLQIPLPNNFFDR